MILNRSTLRQLPAGIAAPGYDPAAVRAGIVHLGLGGFHRAHMARYTHALMPEALDWGIVGAGLMPGDRAKLAALADQDGLYVLVEREGAEERAAVIGSLAGVIDASESTAELLARIEDPAIRIVSLTVTGHGYCLDAERILDPAHPMIAHDLANPRTPRSAIGVLVEANRRRRGGRAFTALSCDNIPHNGRVLRGAVLDFARRIDPGLAEWIAAEARFPSTMVDRITPVSTPADAAAVAARYGAEDAWPVISEAFSQWVIEDDFADGRPDWDAAGAQFVSDVAPYETMKLRLLNASHLAVSGPARLMGMATIDEAMRDPLIRRYVAALMARETAPTVPPVPGIDLTAYQARLIERFANTAIRDTNDRVNNDASVNYLLDPIRDRIAAGDSIHLLAFALAAWVRRVRGEDDAGRPIEIVHPLAAELRAAARAGTVLAIQSLFGTLGRDARVIDAVGRHLEAIEARGTRTALAEALR